MTQTDDLIGTKMTTGRRENQRPVNAGRRWRKGQGAVMTPESQLLLCRQILQLCEPQFPALFKTITARPVPFASL